ncbi:hypothetical protein DPMN_092953 [Dreissena polymorpha]|uniref:Uncharacterized protein n=1 Tax=Dreissena polymorpha TaxID=45954 RepID=A0A9D4L2F4_DREPO|nr:hypothetical protein DPMN_092953 [Dreissena polymorpha]
MFYYSYVWKIPRPLGNHVFQPTGNVFEKATKTIFFHKDRKINVTSTVFTRLYYSHIMKKCPAPVVAMFFNQPASFFNLVQDIIGMNLLIEFHEERTINVASRMKNVPPLGIHVFQANITIFELIQDIKKTNLLTIFHEDWTINVASRVLTRLYKSHIWKNAPSLGGHVFQSTSIIFVLVQDIIGMNLLTKFHEDQTINVASRPYIARKNAPLLGSHVFQANVPIFNLIQDIIETNLLIIFHEDWIINLASREFTRQMLTPHNGQRTTDKRRSKKLIMRRYSFIKIG